MAVVFEVAGASCHHFLAQYLVTLAERRGADNFKPHVNELDYVVGKAVRRMGPRVVLEHVDLQITGDESSYDFQRSWLLPVHGRLETVRERRVPAQQPPHLLAVACA